MKSERHVVLALAVSCAVLQEGGTRSEASGPTEGVRSTKDQGLSFRERGDEAGTRDNVQGESGPRRTHAADRSERGETAPADDDPKAQSTAKLGKGAHGRGSTTCGPFPCEVK